jgi:hypothetical protein
MAETQRVAIMTGAAGGMVARSIGVGKGTLYRHLARVPL